MLIIALIDANIVYIFSQFDTNIAFSTFAMQQS